MCIQLRKLQKKSKQEKDWELQRKRSLMVQESKFVKEDPDSPGTECDNTTAMGEALCGEWNEDQSLVQVEEDGVRWLTKGSKPNQSVSSSMGNPLPDQNKLDALLHL